MLPKVALFFCAVFVLFLLRLDRKQAPEVSLALWIPTIWMLSIASKPLGVWFPSAGGDADSGSMLDQVFLCTLLCMGLFILARSNRGWFDAIKEQSCLMLLMSYMLVSISWSDIPLISFKRYVRELIAIVMAFLVLTEHDPRHAVQTVIRRTIYILIPFSLLLIKYFPAYGIEFHRWSGERMWIGVALQKNGLGRLCLIASFFLVWSLASRRSMHDICVPKYQTHVELFMLIMTLWLLKGPAGAYPATAIGALAAGLLALVGLSWMRRLQLNFRANTSVAIIAFIIMIGVLTPMYGGSTVSGFTSAFGRDETLTGRTEIWAGLLPLAMRQAVLGHGFGGFWTSRSRDAHGVNEAHNGYLDLLLDGGFVGLLLVSMFLISCCRKAQREMIYDFDWGVLSFCYVLMAVLHNISESSINSFTSHLTAILLFLAVSYSAAPSYAWRVSPEEWTWEQEWPPTDFTDTHV